MAAEVFLPCHWRCCCSRPLRLVLPPAADNHRAASFMHQPCLSLPEWPQFCMAGLSDSAQLGHARGWPACETPCAIDSCSSAPFRATRMWLVVVVLTMLCLELNLTCHSVLACVGKLSQIQARFALPSPSNIRFFRLPNAIMAADIVPGHPCCFLPHCCTKRVTRFIRGV
ncbi:hypothetical protein BAUCODRAFT_532429 [Baudoinia panamericana UAMH 10762]|uniref:Uncharacterized protein n=1 Tax=Baudoinia panamericana (strain UAMH 10762) TaxID=717646 RepID=M2MF27_BAUPA|nr:uncharacterized protein BAUCODRAFT_532429 [Baudoinia panamericana UAMH 10762]EMC95226.1 hypothetical protein BAUCODRAFT_532429 [Baudoinia panamericana UAMH 10762]